MADAAAKLATYADLVALGPDVRAEVIRGVVTVTPSPSPSHQSAVGNLHADLLGPFQRGRGGPGGWWFIQDVDVSFGRHDIVRPDITGWRKENVPSFPREQPVAFRPDWICQALSPGNAATDLGDKRAIYEQAEVPWYWVPG